MAENYRQRALHKGVRWRERRGEVAITGFVGRAGGRIAGLTCDPSFSDALSDASIQKQRLPALQPSEAVVRLGHVKESPDLGNCAH